MGTCPVRGSSPEAGAISNWELVPLEVGNLLISASSNGIPYSQPSTISGARNG